MYMSMYMYWYIYRCIDVDMYMYIYIYIYTCICVCVCIYIYIYNVFGKLIIYDDEEKQKQIKIPFICFYYLIYLIRKWPKF